MKPKTELRLALFRNGFAPVANERKRPVQRGWNKARIDESTILRNDRCRGPDTGIRLGEGLAAIDFDIDDEIAMKEIGNAAFEAVAVLRDPDVPLLVRFGNGDKAALFVRVEREFGRIHSHGWVKPGQTEDDGAHRVEIFANQDRQFGAFGECGPCRQYRWEGPSPLDTHRDELPVLTKQDCFTICDVVDATLKRLGWQQVLRSKSGENANRVEHDLTDKMTFNCDDGVTHTLAELEGLARRRRLPDGLRCSASWLEGPSAKRTDRCIIGATRTGTLTIFETASATTHMPRPVEIDMNEVAARLRRAKEHCNA